MVATARPRYKMKSFNDGLAKRLALFPKFPKGTALTWFGESVGTVVGHDYKNGRVKMSNGRSFNPEELVVDPSPPEAQS